MFSAFFQWLVSPSTGSKAPFRRVKCECGHYKTAHTPNFGHCMTCLANVRYNKKNEDRCMCYRPVFDNKAQLQEG